MPRWPAAVSLVVVAGAWLRLARLDLIEFKGDEQEALNLGIHLLADPPWAGGVLPLHGMPSSQGIANAPLFNWIMAGAWALTHHPVGATALVGLANALALYPLWRWARRRLDPERALLVAATVAVSPFSVLLSRKLWAQDLLFPALVCLLWAVEYWQARRVFQAATWFGVAALPIGQLHQSGPIALAMFPLAVTLASWRDRRGLIERLGALTRLSGWQYGVLVVLLAVHAFFWIPYLVYLQSVPLEALANRQRLDHFEPALFLTVVRQIVPLDLFYFFGPDQADFLGSPWRRFAYGLAVAFGAPLAIVGVLGWARSAARLPIVGIWWWLIIAAFTAARIPTYPFYALVLSPLPAALVAGGFDQRWGPAWLERTLLAVRWAYVVALLSLTVATGLWLSDRGGSRGDYGIVYGVRDRQARVLLDASPPGAADTRLTCHEPPGEVRWIMEWVLRAPPGSGVERLCDGWGREGRRDVYRWTVRR